MVLHQQLSDTEERHRVSVVQVQMGYTYVINSKIDLTRRGLEGTDRGTKVSSESSLQLGNFSCRLYFGKMSFFLFHLEGKSSVLRDFNEK